jgi:RimJ/RimL family protein N-acetyltransferase
LKNKAPPANAPTLETERLVLHPIATEDADALHRISNEPSVRRYLWDDGPVANATIRDLISESAMMFAGEGIGLFGVRRRGGENVIGFCDLFRLEDMAEPELAYQLTQRARDEGLPPRHHWPACATPSRMRP